ncbi:MAG TPA: 2Fe-2S iron-sulfur cluster-binding protein [Candidatus Latescibacteria bacterium]|nr:2Fe-2S iron-sulfur cluster-binding protein [Candidatus Latescibacterota bacterium]HRU23837.1 2Fe-2S iron-sulfur cluster-binding protein [Candidatus Latescibacterota bacterium]
MPRITFLPADVTVEVSEGTSILDAALDNGISLTHNCGGVGACSTCHVIIRDGEDSLSEITQAEDDRLSMAEGLTLHSRLACQAFVGTEDVVVEIPVITSRLSHDA